jgi:hypothetical protein
MVGVAAVAVAEVVAVAGAVAVAAGSNRISYGRILLSYNRKDSP